MEKKQRTIEEENDSLAYFIEVTKNMRRGKQIPYKMPNMRKYYDKKLINRLMESGFSPVPGYEDAYWVNKYGDVYDWLSDSYPESYYTFDGYEFVYLRAQNGSSMRKSVHRLVAETFCDNDDWLNKDQVDHIDGNRGNNCAHNLRWVTRYENCSSAHNKKVKCIETDKIYNSIKEAEKEIGASGIGACCRGKVKTVKGFHWEFYKEENSISQRDNIQYPSKYIKKEDRTLDDHLLHSKMRDQIEEVRDYMDYSDNNEYYRMHPTMYDIISESYDDPDE